MHKEMTSRAKGEVVKAEAKAYEDLYPKSGTKE